MKVTFKEMLFEKSVTSFFSNEWPPRSGKMDLSGFVGKRVIK